MRVTSHQGERESRSQGEVGQVNGWNRNREVREMRTAETVLNIIRERGQQGLPLEGIYRLLCPFALRLLESYVIRKAVMRSSKGGDWKSAIKVTRWSPTLLSSTVLKTSRVGDCPAEFNFTEPQTPFSEAVG